MDLQNTVKSFLLMTIFIVLFSNGIESAVDPALVPPASVTNLTPHQRTFATIGWTNPPNFAYQSFNLYYRRVDDPNFRVVNNIQAFQYKLSSSNTGSYIMPATAYVFQVSGVTIDGRESPPAIVPLTLSVLTPLDPKRDASKGITGVNCGIGTDRIVFCSWVPGSNPLVKVNVRAKCKKPSGHLAIKRRSVRRETSIQLFGLPPNSFCKLEVHPIYQAVATSPQINNVYGKKYKMTLTTPSLPPF
jgi:hypothetical protein